jgi:hydrogenase maturation factor HypE
MHPNNEYSTDSRSTAEATRIRFVRCSSVAVSSQQEQINNSSRATAAATTTTTKMEGSNLPKSLEEVSVQLDGANTALVEGQQDLVVQRIQLITNSIT